MVRKKPRSKKTRAARPKKTMFKGSFHRRHTSQLPPNVASEIKEGTVSFSMPRGSSSENDRSTGFEIITTKEQESEKEVHTGDTLALTGTVDRYCYMGPE